MAQATDLMLDLKTGYLVGAIPRKQQIGQFLGTWLGPMVIMALIFGCSIGLTDWEAERLPAPQGQALASMIQGILGGDVPVQKYLSGAGIGVILSASGIGGLGNPGWPGFLPSIQYRADLYDWYDPPGDHRSQARSAIQ